MIQSCLYNKSEICYWFNNCCTCDECLNPSPYQTASDITSSENLPARAAASDIKMQDYRDYRGDYPDYRG